MSQENVEIDPARFSVDDRRLDALLALLDD